MAKNEVEKQVLNRVTPTPEYRKKIKEIIQEIKEKLQQEIVKRKLPVTIELVGSTAKDTYLKDNLDIDLFLLFPTNFSKEDIGKQALSIGKKLLTDTEESYAEHPYLRGFFKDFKIEIVPCYKIENASQKLSAVDRTPLHTQFVKKHLKEQQKQEIRLFKQFLKGIGCYGAEAEIEGFSGYLCEILVIKYRDFSNLIKNAQKWKHGIKLVLSEGKYPDFDTPLVFIDPVDSDRNVSSALSKEKFDLFVKACEEYIQNPRITFFFPNTVKPWPIDKIRVEIEKQKCLYVGVKFDKPDIIPENLFPQVRKGVRSIWDTCERNDFTIYDAVFHVDKNSIFIVIKTEIEPLSKTLVHMGPPTRLKKYTDGFIHKWKGDSRVTKKPYEKNGRLYVEIEREYIQIEEFLKEKVKNLSMGKHLDDIVKNKYKIVELNDFLKNNFRVFWTEYLDKKMPWERQ